MLRYLCRRMAVYACPKSIGYFTAQTEFGIIKLTGTPGLGVIKNNLIYDVLDLENWNFTYQRARLMVPTLRVRKPSSDGITVPAQHAEIKRNLRTTLVPQPRNGKCQCRKTD